MNGKGHGMHSPFVYRFIRDVLNDRKPYPEYATVEALRRRLLRDQSEVEIREFGAGTSGRQGNTRTVSSIARRAAKSPRLAQLLFRIAKYYQPSNMLELGTSLGISGSYLQLGQPDAELITMEGMPGVAFRAGVNFAELGLRPRIIEGNFDDTLPGLLAVAGTLDLVFVDGNHRRKPTEQYFSMLLPHIGNDSIIIFDDIHWSPDMEAAWDAIRNHEAVRCSIDLFFFGIVLFRNEFREKQHFMIRF